MPPVLPLAVAALACMALAGPARAGATPTTFTLVAGELSISAPTGIEVVYVTTAGRQASVSLGQVTVTDARGALAASWTTQVSTTSFTTGGATPDETVPAGSISYSSGAGCAARGQVGAMVPSVGVDLATPKTAASWGGVGSDTVTWVPRLTLTLRDTQLPGTYRGTVTHSVS